MAGRIDKFNQRLEKANQIKAAINDVKTNAQQEDMFNASVTHEEVAATSLEVVTNEASIREKSLKASIDLIAGKMLFEKSAEKENDGFIFDILSNTVSFETDTESASDFIEFENELFAVNPRSIVDMAANTVMNIRTAYLRNELKNAASVVIKSLSDLVASSDRFYLLPDNTDFFNHNIKSAFTRGYRFIWRSIVAAYVRYDKKAGMKNISVIDLFEKEPAQVNVKIEQSEEYGTHIFTRTGKIQVKELDPLSYWATALTFWREYGNKIGVSFDANRLALTGDTLELLCNGKSFTLLYSSKLYKIEAQTARSILTNYFRKYNKAISRLNGCTVFADHLKNTGIKGNFEYIESVDIGQSLYELKRRVKAMIPLWQETLPKLALQRIAVAGRLGEYILVDEGKTVPNTFGAYSIPCNEKLMLPARHKVIKFPLTISGINNKRFIAQVGLEEEFAHETAFDVTLKYDFNNENSYDFKLSRGDKKYALVIEEGLPEKTNLPFEFQIKDDDKIMEAINDELISLLNCVRQRKPENFYRPFYENGVPKERPWEYDCRVICNKIASLILGLSYSTREGKNFSRFESILREISPQIADAYESNVGDNIDRCYIGLVHSTIALFSDNYAFDNDLYNSFLEWRKGHRYLEHAVEAKILCNPTFDTNTIDDILDLCKGETIIRTFSLPLLANDALIDYICVSRRDWLNKAIVALKKYFSDIYDSVKKADAQGLKSYVLQIRDGYEFTLGLLKLRGTEYWSAVKAIEQLLPVATDIERTLYTILSRNTPHITEFREFYRAQNWRDRRDRPVGNDLWLSRITFDGDESFKNLRLMHPVALTAITYLEGNPDIQIIGCGLKDEVD